ncbi:hypothetical protein [Pyruvatibacter mobilis]|uniref:hypothetical protein n=1 Tax=Pyruvatibacter mobilis TaxID=1712261 RepID=UPI003BACEBBB
MSNLILTALLIVAAVAAWRTLKDKGVSRRSAVEEAARRATQHMSGKSDAQTLEAGKDGVYRPTDRQPR